MRYVGRFLPLPMVRAINVPYLMLRRMVLSERPVEQQFLRMLFVDLLDYTAVARAATHYIAPKRTSQRGKDIPDFVLGIFTPGAKVENWVGVGELKSLGDSLDTPQSRYPYESPVEQAFRYAQHGQAGVEWVIVSNLEEIRLYRNGDVDAYEPWTIEEVTTMCGSKSTCGGRSDRAATIPKRRRFYGDTVCFDYRDGDFGLLGRGSWPERWAVRCIANKGTVFARTESPVSLAARRPTANAPPTPYVDPSDADRAGIDKPRAFAESSQSLQPVPQSPGQGVCPTFRAVEQAAQWPIKLEVRRKTSCCRNQCRR